MRKILGYQDSIWKLLLILFPASLIGFSGAQEFQAHPSTQLPSRLVTLDILKQWEEELSNWGRWGSDDQRGTLNLITPEKTRQAAGLVRTGETVTLQHFVIEEKAIDSQAFGDYEHWMTNLEVRDGEVIPVRVKDGEEPSFAMDGVQFELHDGMMSHVDALCHYRSEVDGEYVIFNGYPQNLTSSGCEDLAIDRMGTSYVTRGILVDMPLLRGVDWLEPSTPIYVEDLEAWEEFAGVKIGSGDALFIRGGRWALRDAKGPWAYGQGGAGLHASVLPWLKERDIAILISDAANDVQPSGVAGINRPVHQLTQVNLGLPIVDNGYMQEVAEVAERLGRWEFMTSIQINPIKAGTASPFNAHATF